MIEKLEIKINKIKKKINPKILGVIAFMAIGAITIFAMEMANNFKRQKNLVQDEYNRAMYELVGYVNNVEIQLSKLQITTDNRLRIVTLADIWRQSNLAKTNLNLLPITQGDMLNASKYLAQLSDFSYSLMSKLSSGGKIEAEDSTKIKEMYSMSNKLSDATGNVYEDLNSGRIKWDEVQKSASENLDNGNYLSDTNSIQNIGKTFQEYEGLIYDGAFSDHILSIKPKLLEGLSECSEDEAKSFVEEILGKDNIEKIEYKRAL